MSDTLGTRNTGQRLEELVQAQALSLDLREAVMACLCGRESRRWTIAELVERFKNLGVCASRASVTAALAELSAFWLVYASGQHCLANTLRSKKRSYTTTANSKFWADPFIHFTRQRGDPLQYTTK